MLNNDKREIFRAAADAQKIADYILSFHPEFAAGDLNEVASEATEGETFKEAA